jgi:hypothetical protein
MFRASSTSSREIGNGHAAYVAEQSVVAVYLAITGNRHRLPHTDHRRDLAVVSIIIIIVIVMTTSTGRPA